MRTCLFVAICFLAMMNVVYFTTRNRRRVLLSDAPADYCRLALEAALMLTLCGAFVILCALRSLDIPDTIPYLSYYNAIKLDSFQAFFSRYEFDIGFEYLAKICKLVFPDNFAAFLAIIPIINIAAVYLIFHKHAPKFRELSVTTYIFAYGLYYNLIVLRQGLAITFIIAAVFNLRKNPLKILLYVIIACLFHKTAIIMLVLIPVYFIKFPISKPIFAVIFATLVVIYSVGILKELALAIVTSLIERDFLKDFLGKFLIYLPPTNVGLAKSSLIFYALATFVIIYKDEVKADRFLIVAALGFAILAMFSGEPVFLRLADYFFIPLFLVIPEILDRRHRLVQWGMCAAIMAAKVYSLWALDIAWL